MADLDGAAQLLPWVHPLEAAARHAGAQWVLLYSGVKLPYSGQYSFLAVDPAEEITGESFAPLAGKLSSNQPWHANAWFGYLGYGLRHDLEILPREAPGMFSLPGLWMVRFRTLYRFDHQAERVERYGPPQEWESTSPGVNVQHWEVKTLHSPMTKHEYLEKVRAIVEAVRAGSLYQANLTRKFTGEFTQHVNSFALFCRLCEISPAPYSAYLKMGDAAILSSSPERFLAISPEGHVTTRPIKGSARRFDNAEKDRQAKEALRESAKNRAENLMIVDLMRNDLSRVAKLGTVQAEGLFEVTTHAHVHHMASTVNAWKKAEVSALEVVKACFPPGSMTGAPKIRAMKLCSALEQVQRGVYSGALGWFGGDGSADLSVVIRALIVRGTQFEFQVGGGIVADSTPEDEWQETLTKARGIAQALGVNIEQLEALLQ